MCRPSPSHPVTKPYPVGRRRTSAPLSATFRLRGLRSRFRGRGCRWRSAYASASGTRDCFGLVLWDDADLTRLEVDRINIRWGQGARICRASNPAYFSQEENLGPAKSRCLNVAVHLRIVKGNLQIKMPQDLLHGQTFKHCVSH